LLEVRWDIREVPPEVGVVELDVDDVLNLTVRRAQPAGATVLVAILLMVLPVVAVLRT